MSKKNELMSLKSECLACRRCSIGGQQVNGEFLSNVFSNMNYTANIMVVGQNPGRDETEKGEPFVGTSGKMFDQLFEEVLGMNRAYLYISNCVRCATPDSRRPTFDEIETCEYFLEKEISILKPRVVITLGGPAFTQLTGMNGQLGLAQQYFPDAPVVAAPAQPAAQPAAAGQVVHPGQTFGE